MKDTLLAIGIVFGTILIMLTTSILLSWEWIGQHWVRQGIVILLIFVELFHGVIMYKALSKRISERLGG